MRQKGGLFMAQYIYGRNVVVSRLKEAKDIDEVFLLDTFKEILGYSETKPFECVGTYGEARYAVSLLIEKIDKENLPFLLKYYLDNYELELDGTDILKYNEENNINSYYDSLVRKELDKYV